MEFGVLKLRAIRNEQGKWVGVHRYGMSAACLAKSLWLSHRAVMVPGCIYLCTPIVSVYSIFSAAMTSLNFEPSNLSNKKERLQYLLQWE